MQSARGKARGNDTFARKVQVSIRYTCLYILVLLQLVEALTSEKLTLLPMLLLLLKLLL